MGLDVILDDDPKTATAVGLVLMVCAAACSGGGRRASSPTTVKRAASSPSVPASYEVVGLGACPSSGTTNLAVLNRGVVGLGKRLVPIEALNVRICEDGSRWTPANGVLPGALITSARLKPRDARQFEDRTNRLPTGLPGSPSCTGPGGGVTFVALTFANDSQRVSLAQQVGSCSTGQLSNGYLTLNPTGGWSQDLLAYTAATQAVRGTRSSGPGGPSGNTKNICCVA